MSAIFLNLDVIGLLVVLLIVSPTLIKIIESHKGE